MRFLLDQDVYAATARHLTGLGHDVVRVSEIKALWTGFESRFGGKATLETKFGQLADLRNGIRHSRSVHEVTRKEGEAAILWFKQVLAI